MIKCGSFNLEYSNNIIQNLCETLVQYKKLAAFRYTPISTLFMGRENLHRKIELHAPLYLIKKIFISSPSRFSNLRESII